MIEAKTFLVILENYFGIGESIAEAYRNARRHGFKPGRGVRPKAYVVAISCDRDEISFSADIMVRWRVPEGTTVMNWEQTL